MKKQHYYSFTFIDGNMKNTIYASVYLGLSSKDVTLEIIKRAKEDAKASNKAVLLSCCYLGKMTYNKMTKE